MTDRELLEKYVRDGSREALGELMQRHVGMVRGTAMREVRNGSLADDVTQAVFLVLMRRAKSLSRRVRIGGWLFKVTRYAAADARRREARRTHHEREASKMANAQERNADWAEIEPVLNGAIAALGRADRDVVVMRYLEGRSMDEIAQAEGATENAMRQRLMRALRRLREKIEKYGVAGSAAAVEPVLVEKALCTAPPGLVERISGMIGGARVPSESSVAIAKGVMNMMRNVKIAAVTGVSAVLLFGGYAGLRTAFADGTDAVTPAPAANQSAPTTAPVQADVAKSPTDALRAAYNAAMAGDADTLLAACDGLTDKQVAMLKRMAPALKAVTDLEQAIADKFGDAARATLERGVVGVDPADLANATEVIDGDKATVDIGSSGPGKVEMVRVNGQWKISAKTIATMPPALADRVVKMVPILQQIRADVMAGKYATIDQVQQAMGAAMQGGGR